MSNQMRATPTRGGPPALSADEIDLRRELLARFHEVARYATTITASDFQAILGSFGLSFGDEITDRIMLLCKIDPSGQARAPATALCPSLFFFLVCACMGGRERRVRLVARCTLNPVHWLLALLYDA